MSLAQVTVAFAVELLNFHNIDLFHQGAFQIRCHFKNNSPYPIIIEPPKVWDRLNNASFSECVANSFVSPADLKTNVPCKAVSKSILIIYKEETVRMYDVFEQTMHFQIEAILIEELIYKAEIVLVVELWFAEKKNESFEEMKTVCERQLKVHLVPSQGLHHHTTVMFDYYYLAAVDLLIHATLVSISPCYLKASQSSVNNFVTDFNKNVSRYQSWHSILFNTSNNYGRRHAACLIHSHLCRLLTSVTESLFKTFQEALSFFNSEKGLKINAKLCSQLCPFQSNSKNWKNIAPNELEKLVTVLKCQTSEDDMADQFSIDITKLSSRIVILFNEYLRNVSYNVAYVDSLSMYTHKLRIKRFSEAFFFRETSIIHLLSVYDPKYANPIYLSTGRTPLTSVNRDDSSDDSDCEQISLRTSSCSDDSTEALTDEHTLARRSSATLVRQCSIYPSFSTNGHELLVEKVRDSTYYKELPPLPIECPDTDGQSHDQPIIIEEIFLPESRRPNNAEIRSASSSSSDSEVDIKEGPDKYNKEICNNNESKKALPVIRKLTPYSVRKDFPIPEENVIFESPEFSGADDIARRRVYTNEGCNKSGVVNSLSTRILGVGTLQRVYDSETCTDDFGVSHINVMSQSMSDLSVLDSEVGWTKILNMYRKRSSSWACDFRSFSMSYFTFPLLCTEKKNLIDKVTNFTISKRSQSVVVSTAPLNNEANVFSKSSPQLPSHARTTNILSFCQLKSTLMADLKPYFQGNLYSDLVELPASKRPYFSLRDSDSLSLSSGLHYVICVHGLDGEHRDLRLVKTYLSLALPEQRFEFLMSEANEQDNFADINIMKERLVDEVIEKISELKEKPDKISFIGHSLGCVLIRAAIASPRMNSIIPRLYTFLSLGGPHLGTIYGSSMLVNVGLWVMQKVRKSTCLQQLSMKDSLVDLRRCYLYELSGQPCLEYFKYVLLASSPQDRYVPYHSTRIELCRAAVKDNSEMGVVYMEMVTRLLQRLLRSGRTTVVRYDAHYTLPRSANNYIGRAAHIALIDSELFLEKFISVSAAKYFR